MAVALNLDIEEIPLNIDDAKVENVGTNIEGLELLTNKSKESKNIASSLDELEKTLNETVDNDAKTSWDSTPVTQTWDGFAKVNSVPEVAKPQTSSADELHEKFKYIRLLEELEKKTLLGIPTSNRSHENFNNWTILGWRFCHGSNSL